ncbi:MAG TPA: T9SS type A sorting domain-containing protein, partial [Bacteroidia bacterium]|nr:T9SS type A sorting domain-containing protein [Bacteroidia bacterium]
NCSSVTKDTLIGSPVGGTFSGVGVSGANFNPSTAGIGVHTVIYTYTNKQGCTNSDSVKLIVQDCLGINEVTNSFSSQVTMYPNPFSQLLNINVAADETVSATIFDILGNNMGTWQLRKGINEINTQAIPSGVYSLQLKTKQSLLNKRLVKVD